MKKIRVGVIGCGSIARHRHLPEYNSNPNVEIVAVSDRVEERASEIASLYNATVYTNYEELLKDKTIDAVSVCLPNALHAPVSIAALNAGKHVLCEKPMATSTSEAEAMIAAAKENNVQLMIGHNQRFVRSHEMAREMINEGKLGKVYSFRTAFGHGGPEGWSVDGKDSWFFDKKRAFIGAMGDLGVHKADLMRYILGDEVAEVAAFVETKAKDFATVDDNAVCLLKTTKGTIGTLTASWSFVGKEDNSTVIYGEKGILRLEDDPEYSLIFQMKDGEVEKHQLGQIQSNDEDGQSSSHVIDSFIDALLNNREVPIPGQEGMKSLQVVLGALEAAETRRTVKL